MRITLLILCLFTVDCTSDHSKCVSRESYDKQIDGMLQILAKMSKVDDAQAKAIDEIRQRALAQVDATNGTLATHKKSIESLQKIDEEIVGALTDQSKFNTVVSERFAAGR